MCCSLPARILGTCLLLSIVAIGNTESFLISNVNVVEVDRGSVLEHRDVLIVDGIISHIQPHGSTEDVDAQVIDGDGKYVVPGFWDMHVHFRTRKFIGETADDARVAEEAALLPVYLNYGVTSVFDMGTDIPEHLEQWRSEIEQGQRMGPRLFLTGQKVEGPGAVFAGSLEISSTEDVDRVLGAAEEADLDGVKVMALWIEPSVQQYLLDESSRLGLRTFVHALETFRGSELAESGFHAIAHMDNLLPEAASNFETLVEEVNARRSPAEAPGDWYRELAPRFFQGIDRQALEDSLTTLAANRTAVISTFNSNRHSVIRDQIEEEVFVPLQDVGPNFAASVRNRYERRLSREVTESDRDVLEGNIELMQLIAQSDVLFLIGTDSGFGNRAPGASYHYELAALQEAGASPAYLLRAATMNPAIFMGTEQLEGTVAEGMRADLVLLDANPLIDIQNSSRIHAVIRDGQVVDIKDP